MSNSNPIKRLFDLYTSDLSYDEIEKLIKKESSEVYEFFAKDISKPDTSRNKFIRILIFARNLFNAFLLKLTPARRIVYLISIFFMIVGAFNDFGSYIVLGILLLNALLAFELVDKLIFKDEISLAKKIQSKLIPQAPPKNTFFDIDAYYESAREVSGDYFDFIEPRGESENTFIIIGDISGKGMAAALYMIRVQAIIHSMFDYFKNFRDLLINLNKNFTNKLSSGFFLTLSSAKIDKEGNLSICNAGHTPTIHYKINEHKFELVNPKGIGIGLSNNGKFEESLEEILIKPGKGDLFIFYTDGLTETMDRYKNQYGDERLKKLVVSNYDKSPKELINVIRQSVADFRGQAISHDDLTLVVLKAK
ncbi:MAG: SpoIIE family protein phosphatase [Melioribacteraceae bacterium]|nr:SpoIIE family protein phosphatase [Melioribacteraceae bacterium]